MLWFGTFGVYTGLFSLKRRLLTLTYTDFYFKDKKCEHTYTPQYCR